MPNFVVKARVNSQKLRKFLEAKLKEVILEEISAFPDFLGEAVYKGEIKVEMKIKTHSAREYYRVEINRKEHLGDTVAQLLDICDDISVEEISAPVSEAKPEEIVEEPPLELLKRSVTTLNLSVRARRPMIRLNIQTLGDLIEKSGDDLLEVKDFGICCLNEVREKLEALGLRLKN